ncbi:MAG: HAMP domain-containing sensor histidine kinase [Gammaproteobacteria bacterium]
MRFPRPRSLTGLLFLGFGLVIVPLLAAVVWALVQLEHYANQSESLVLEGVAATQHTRVLQERLRELERLAKLFRVQQTEDYLELMTDDAARFQARLDALAPLAARAGETESAIRLGQKAEAAVFTLRTQPADSELTDEAIADLEALSAAVAAFSTAINEFIGQELDALQQAASDFQATLAWQTAALVPFVLILVGVFTALISRPLRQIDKAIGQLGQSGFAKPIQVDGPADLEALGRQLEWLRVRLLELAQEKNRFLRHMSHELKTPLANIREGTDLLLDGTVGNLDDPQREVTDILRSNGVKLQRLIENLLFFSAWQTKSEMLMLSDFALPGLIGSVTEDHRLAIRAQEIDLALDVEDVRVNADEEKLRTALDNLLSNAVKFTPRGGTIRITARSAENSFVIGVADTGPGIPAEERGRIFDAFYQGSNQQHDGPVAGTGIGLSVVQECAEAHGGSVELRDADGGGAHFRLHIPQEQISLGDRMAANE